MLDAIGAGLTPRIGDRDWKDIWLESPEYQRTLQEIQEIKAEGLARTPLRKGEETTCAIDQTQFSHLANLISSRCHTILGSIDRGDEAE